MASDFYDQEPFDLRLDWGIVGLERAVRRGDAIVIVDVLSFSTSVAVATVRGVRVIPCHPSADASALAAQHDAQVAAPRDSEGLTLSPSSLLNAPEGVNLVLPSPNGSACAAAAGDASPVFFGALVNAGAVSDGLEGTRPVTVIAAGERWPDGKLRVAAEDLLGAGAILAGLEGEHSPEALSAVSLFYAAESELERYVALTGSGIELTGRGFADDVALATQLDAYSVVPELKNGVIQRRP